MIFMRLLPLLLAALLTALLRPAAGAVDNALSYIPRDCELVFAANVDGVVASDVFKTQWDRRTSNPQIQQQFDAFKNLTGVDPLKDVRKVAVGGLIDEDRSIVLVIEGAFPTDKLIDLVRFNAEYKKSDVQGYAVHQWNDKGENFAAILPEGGLLIARSSQRIEEALTTHKQVSSSILSTPEGQELAELLASSTMAGVIYRPVRRIELAAAAEAVHVTSCLIRVDMRSQEISATADLRMDTEANAVDGREALEGLVALGRLQDVKPILKDLAARSEVTTGKNAKSVQVTATMANSQVNDLIEHLPMKR
ncbi:hypothetical protein HZA57_04990 [Candidatus Poribacteria bacterium]|nr:hypothetical protein [Candidatus Poribacteria bacterium]